jgi:glutamate carboxypeptidase
VALIEVRGIEKHVGTGYWDAASAVAALADKAVKLQALSNRERRWLVNVGELHGGTRRNLVPGYAYAKVDLRTHTQADWNELIARVQGIVNEEIPGTTASIRLVNHRPAMEPTEKTEQLMATVRQAGRDLGQPIEFMDSEAGSDANFPAALGVPTLDGFGPSGANTMTRDEWIEVASLSDRAALLALTLHMLATAGT